MANHRPQPWPGSATRAPSLTPFASSRRDFITSALLGRMTPEDQAYMARALLQMSDEIAVLKQEMVALRLAMQVEK